ncbi:hypothetical protein KY363_05785 [Candidatus Woesearchaeota archaeon]|nr:hypothetical protein [Candidatus Woesearchaeota archaeon]
MLKVLKIDKFETAQEHFYMPPMSKKSEIILTTPEGVSRVYSGKNQEGSKHE